MIDVDKRTMQNRTPSLIDGRSVASRSTKYTSNTSSIRSAFYSRRLSQQKIQLNEKERGGFRDIAAETRERVKGDIDILQQIVCKYTP